VADALVGRPRQPASGPLPAVGPDPGATTAGATTADATAQGTSPATGPIPADVGADGPGGLPRRRKTAGTAGTATAGHVPRSPGAPSGGVTGGPRSSPEQARALLSSIQQGLRSGRDANVGNGDGTR
jgi:hypothetical protein